MTLRSLALTSAALCAAIPVLVPANAADDRGWYVGLGSGLNLASNLRLTENPVVIGGTVYRPSSIERDDAWRGSLAVGYAWGNNLRLEAEFGYSDPAIRGVIVNGTHVPVSGADLSEITLFGNAIYDLPITDRLSLPLGGGLGLGLTRLETGADKITANGFAFQAITGLTYHWNEHVDFAFDYRYVQITGLDYYGSRSDGGGHNLMLSLRWFFGRRTEAAPAIPQAVSPQPAPPPALAPAPPPIKTYIVFFDFNKSYLTDAAQSVVAEAVRVARTSGMVKVQIAGHTDTVGPDDYNMKLSLARAIAVKDEMIQLGMDGISVGIEGKGYHEPLVATGPNIREPQNRRAVIDLGS